ncbi:MAG: LysR family transcriptional regulator [Porticoccaceae bacterium]
MRYTLRQLQVFLAAAHHQNITRAADSLNMSQSAASGALSDLERQFGIQIFDRIGKRLQINELGRYLHPLAESLMAQADAFERALGQSRDIGQLKVGATLTIGNYLAVGIVARLMAEQPGARVTLEVANTADIAGKVASFELDIGLIEGELNRPELEMIPWRDDELVVFCAPDHPLSKLGQLSDDDLLAATWIVREAGSGTRQSFDRAMHGLLPNLNLLLELQHTEAIKRAVEARLGISCLSRIALQEAFHRGSLVPLATPQRDFRRRFYFVLHRQKYRTAGINRWIELCQQSD